jgi:hypothetical protein
MKFVVIILFTVFGGHGEGASDDRFASRDACDMARPAIVARFKAALEQTHGVAIVITGSRCGLASEIGATPA